jgi:hypothetical protein
MSTKAAGGTLKLQRAIASGRAGAERAKRRAAAGQAENVAREAKERAQSKAKWKKWLATGDRIYKLARKAVARGDSAFSLSWADVKGAGTIDMGLVDAAESFPGFRAQMHSEDVDHGDSAAPCMTTEHRVEVRWSDR